MYTHDPREFIRGLQQILISNSKKIGLLAGAGTSLQTKKTDEGKATVLIPKIEEMTELVISGIAEKKFSNAIAQIKKQAADDGEKFNLEILLSKVCEKEKVVADETLCGLNKKELCELKELIENKVKLIVSVHEKPAFETYKLVHDEFALWAHNTHRAHAIEIFTLNYDYLFEIALEKYSFPFFDGFVGTHNPFFDSNSVEDDELLKTWTKVWKIHGSLGWKLDEIKKKFYRSNHADGNIMIYPSVLKYDDSKKQPYISYIDRLHRFVKSEDAVLFVCGYSFGDQHINDTILNALSRSRTSHVYVLKKSDLKEDDVVAILARQQPRMSVYGKRHAVIGGRYGVWKLKNEPQQNESIQINWYFDEDAAIPRTEQGKEDVDWTGFGDFKLGDFENFVGFLSYLNHANYYPKQRTKNEPQ